MFQKKVPGYRKGGGIMRLATGGVIGEFPPKVAESISKNKFLKNKGPSLPFQDKITKVLKGPVGKFGKGLGIIGGIGSLAYNLSPSFRGTLGF